MVAQLMLTRVFAKNFGVSLIGDGITFIFTFVNSIVVARLLGPEGRGEYAVLLGISEIVSLLLSGGIYWGITFWLGKQPDSLPKLFGNAIFHLMLVIGFCTIIGFGTAYADFTWMPNIEPANFILLAAVVPLLIATEMLRYFFLGLGQITNYVSVAVFRIVMWTILNIIILGALSATTQGAMVAWLTQLTLTVFLFTGLLVFRTKLGFAISRSLYWNMLQIGAKGMVSQMGSRLMYSGDIFFLNFLLPVGILGNYSVATSAVRVMQRSANVAGTLLFPLSARNQEREIDLLTARVCRHMVFLNMCLSILILVTGRYLLRFLFGVEYEDSFALLAWLLPGFIALAPPIIIGPYLWGRNFPRTVLVAPYVAFIVNISLLVLAIPLFGAVAASVASSIAYVFWSVLLLRYFHRHTDISYRDILLINTVDLASIHKNVRSWILALRLFVSN